MLQNPKSHGFELISHIPMFCCDVTIHGSIAYLANGWGGFSTLDISNISSPRMLGKFASPNYVHSLAINKNIAFVAEYPREEESLGEHTDLPFTYPSGVQFIDVSNPSRPIEINRYIARILWMM